MTEHLVQNDTTSISDDIANDLRVNYDYDSENEKPIILELGVTANSSRNTLEQNFVPYANNYPLDLHINSPYASVYPTFPHAYNIDPTLLYNNPYTNNNRIPTPPTQIPQHSPPHSIDSSSLITRSTGPYSAHIPQSVFSWSTPTAVTSMSLSDIDSKLATEIVPPPVYMTYSGNREYTITKRTNHSRKEKPELTEKDYKRTACDRERTRMRDMNRAFDLLRSKLPITKPNGKKYSKIESLRIAINYINHLQKILEDDTLVQRNRMSSKYLKKLHLRRRSTCHRFENLKISSPEYGSDTFVNLDESRSTWSDTNYISNSQEKWE